MMTHEWHKAALKALHPEDVPYIVMLMGSFGELRGVAPLVQRHDTDSLRFLSSIAIPEPAAVLADSEESLRTLISGVKELGFPLELGRIPADIWEPELLQGSLGRLPFHVIREEGGSPWLQVQPEWEEFEQGISGRRRSDLRRSYRQAEAHGELSVEFLSASEGNPKELLERYIEVERCSWKSLAETTILDWPRMYRFFEHLIENYPGIVFGFLFLGGKPAAAQIGVIHARTLWVLKIAFHEDFRKCSPGVILMHEMIRYAHERRLQFFEFLGYEENWIRTWTTESRRYYTLNLYPYSQRGLTRLGKDVVANLKTRYGRSSLSESGERGQ